MSKKDKEFFARFKTKAEPAMTEAHTMLADEFIAWVEAYAKKICPEGCLPTVGQEREINLFARVTIALRATAAAQPVADGDAQAYGVREAAQYVVDKFKKDEAQGFHTRDRQFAIEILDKALSVTRPNSNTAAD